MTISTSGPTTFRTIDGTTYTINNWHVVDTVGAGLLATMSIHVVNLNSTAVTIRLAHEVAGSTGIPDVAEQIAFDVTIAAYGIFILEPTIFRATDSLLCFSDSTNVNFHGYAMVESA